MRGVTNGKGNVANPGAGLPDEVGVGDNDGSKNMVLASMFAQYVEGVSIRATAVLSEEEIPMDDDSTTNVGTIDADDADGGCSDKVVA